jgi:hypothetical protein
MDMEGGRAMKANMDQPAGRSSLVVRAARSLFRLILGLLGWLLKDGRTGSIYM